MTLQYPLLSTSIERVYWDASSKYKSSQLIESRFWDDVATLLSSLTCPGANSLSFILFSHTNSSVLPASIRLDNSKKFILIYLSCETSSLSQLSIVCREFRAVFKTYLDGKFYLRNLFPLHPGSINNNKLSCLRKKNLVHPRPIDIFFSGNLNNQRTHLHSIVSSNPFPFLSRFPPSVYRRICQCFPLILSRPAKWLDQYNHRLLFQRKFLAGLSPLDYYTSLLQSTISLCPPGFDSPETFRHLESLQAGCVVISLPLPDHPFYRDSSIIQIESWARLPDCVRDLFSGNHSFLQMSKESLRFWEANFSPSATANYIEACIDALPCEH